MVRSPYIQLTNQIKEVRRAATWGALITPKIIVKVYIFEYNFKIVDEEFLPFILAKFNFVFLKRLLP